MTDSIARNSTRLAAFTGLAIFVLLGLLAHRHGIRLSFDSFYYVEYAKGFRHHPPQSFGTAWPFGWPLLGTVAGVIGLSAYHGLLAWSLASVGGLFWLGSSHAPWNRLGLVGGGLLLAATGTFAFTTVVAGVLSETAFALVLLAFALSLSRWPEPRAIMGSAGLALAAFCLRYAGALAFVLLLLWAVIQLRQLRSSGRVRLALLSGAVAGVLAAGLLAWNWTSTGGVANSHSLTISSFARWLGIAADFGWSLPALVGGNGLTQLLGFGTAGRLPLGLVFAAGVITLGWFGWHRAPTPAIRALGFLVAGYAIGLIALRCLTAFDDLSSARMFVPLWVPCLLLAGWLLPAPKLIVAACCGVLVLSVALCVRGASRQIGADVRLAVPIVAAARADELIAINDAAFTLSAHVPQPVIRAPELSDLRWSKVRYLVVAAVPLDRDAQHSAFPLEATALVSTLLDRGDFQTRLHTPELIVLEQVNTPR